MENLKYSEAINELENIVDEIENDETDLDTLIEKVKKASELIRFCRSKLLRTEEEVSKVLSDLKKLSENEKE